jgi:dynein heavy chain
MQVDNMGNLLQTQKEFALRWNVWKALYDWINITEEWRVAPVQQLSASLITGKVDEFSKNAFKMGKANKEDTVVYRLKDTIDEFKKVVPLMEEVANPALKDRHWKKIFELLDQPFDATTPFSTNNLLGFGIMDKIEEVTIFGF